MTVATTTPTVEGILATGLRNRWYAVCPSTMVAPGGLRRVMCLGEPWVVFRTADGRIQMLEDRCPHRGAPLSLGAHLGDRIGCAYHGVEVDASGTVVCVPGMPGCRMEGRQLVRSLPVQEMAGVVLAWFGDELHPEPRPLVMPEPLTDPEVSSFLCHAEWRAPWRFAMENVLDPMHGAFLHRASHSMYAGSKTASFEIEETDRGFVFQKTDQRNVNFDWVEYASTGVDWLHLAIPYPPTAGPGGPFGVVGMVTPATERMTKVFFWRYRRVSGWERAVWRFLYRTTLEERHWEVLEQDRVMLEAMAPDADAREHLYQHDLGVARIRRLLKAEAEQQVTNLVAAGVGTGRRRRVRVAAASPSEGSASATTAPDPSGSTTVAPDRGTAAPAAAAATEAAATEVAATEVVSATVGTGEHGATRVEPVGRPAASAVERA